MVRIPSSMANVVRIAVVCLLFTAAAGGVLPISVAAADEPVQPVVVSPLDNSVDVSTAPTLEVTVSDPDADFLDITFYGREAGNTPDDFFTLDSFVIGFQCQ